MRPVCTLGTPAWRHALDRPRKLWVEEKKKVSPVVEAFKRLFFLGPDAPRQFCVEHNI